MTTVTDAQALGQLHRADEIRDALVTRFPRMPQQQADSVSDFIMERETELRAEVERLRAAYGKAVDAMAAFDKWRRDGCEYHPLQLDELQSQFAAATAALAAIARRAVDAEGGPA